MEWGYDAADEVQAQNRPSRRQRAAPQIEGTGDHGGGGRGIPRPRRRQRRDDEDGNDNEGGGGGGGGGGRREEAEDAELVGEAPHPEAPGFGGEFHFDPNEDVREDVDEVVTGPLPSTEWMAKYPPPSSDFCFLCSMRQDPDNVFYAKLQAIATAATLDEEARCVHMARMYAQQIRTRIASREMPEWNEMAVLRHLMEHDMSQLRILKRALTRSNDILDIYSRTAARKRKGPDGTFVEQPPDPNHVRAMIMVMNFQRTASRQLQDVAHPS